LVLQLRIRQRHVGLVAQRGEFLAAAADVAIAPDLIEQR
jgi:hypothetical protein